MTEANGIKANREPLVKQAKLQSYLNRNNYSYWQRVWRAFVNQKIGLIASSILVFMAIFSFVGPLLIDQSPHVQNVGNRFGESSGAKQIDLIENGHWQGPGVLTKQLNIIDATTEYVRLQWPSQKPFSYRIYRQEQAQTGVGLLVGETSLPWYEDRLDLSAKNYRYSIFAGNALIGEIRALPRPVISRFYAELSGLTTAGSQVNTVTIAAHPLGTDALGRDILARLMAGGQISLGVGFLAPLFAIIMGTILGAAAAVIGNKTDEIIMRFSDVVIALPFLLFVIILNVAFGYGKSDNGVLPMFWALVLMGWPNAAKLVRGQVLLLKEADYIAAAKLLGASNWYLIKVHIIPQLLGVVLVALSFAIPTAIFTEALLSFIGLGVTAPAASWGSLCQEAMSQLQRYPHLLLYPACLISVTVLAFNLLGDSLRDALAVAGGKT